MDLRDILTNAVRAGASDVHLKAGLPVMHRLHGRIVAVDETRIQPDDMRTLLDAAMSADKRARFDRVPELDFAVEVPGVGRFRANAFHQRGAVGLALRSIPTRIPTIQELLLPPVLEQMALEERGLIVATGTTSSGKSTTLASMIDHVNRTESAHVVTIEDPIEFVIEQKLAIVNQREIGIDADTFAHALRAALRQDPDVIMVGEMRDLETMETALTAAETGHLVMSTLHTVDATETVNRILSSFPSHQQPQVRKQIASVLRGAISLRLVPRADGRGRVPAVEVLRMSAHVRELIEDPERTKDLPDAIAQGHVTLGMQTFDQSLMKLLTQGLITADEATRQASKPDDFALRLSGVTSTSDPKWDDFDGTAGGERTSPKAPPAGRSPSDAFRRK